MAGFKATGWRTKRQKEGHVGRQDLLGLKVANTALLRKVFKKPDGQKPKGGAAPAGWVHGAAVLSNPVHVWNKQ